MDNDYVGDDEKSGDGDTNDSGGYGGFNCDLDEVDAGSNDDGDDVNDADGLDESKVDCGDNVDYDDSNNNDGGGNGIDGDYDVNCGDDVAKLIVMMIQMVVVILMKVLLLVVLILIVVVIILLVLMTSRKLFAVKIHLQCWENSTGFIWPL